MRLVSVFLAVALVLVSASAFADKPVEKPKFLTRGMLDCTNAQRVSCGDVVQSSNVGLVNNVSTYSCVAWNESGPEKVFEITLPAPDCWIVTCQLSGMTGDLDIFFLAACDEAQCMEYGDADLTTDCLLPGVYYIVVDGYSGATSDFTLTITCTECTCPSGPPENDTCDGAIELTGSGSLSADLTNATHNYTPSGTVPSCTGYGANGKDIVYVVNLGAGEELFASMSPNPSFDASIYLITDCDDPNGSCVVGDDSGNPEEITYCSYEGGTYYLICDAYSSGAGGPFDLTWDIHECYIPPPPCCPFPYVCYVFDFNESNCNFWTEAVGGEPCLWEWGVPTGIPTVACDEVPVTNVLGTNLAGYYVECCERAIIGPVFIRECCFCMELCHFYDTEARYDGGLVEVSEDGGITWVEVTPARGYDDVGSPYGADCIMGLPIFTGHQNNLAFMRDCFDLTAFIGKEILVGFRFGADSSIFYPGWYIKWVKFGSEQPSRTEKTTWGGVKAMYR